MIVTVVLNTSPVLPAYLNCTYGTVVQMLNGRAIFALILYYHMVARKAACQIEETNKTKPDICKVWGRYFIFQWFRVFFIFTVNRRLNEYEYRIFMIKLQTKSVLIN